MTTATEQRTEEIDLHSLVARVEQRLQHGGANGRRTSEVVRQLSAYAAYKWPGEVNEALDLALRLLTLADLFQRETARRVDAAQELGEFALARLHAALVDIETAPNETAAEIVSLWHSLVVVPRSLFEEIVTDAGDKSLLQNVHDELQAQLRERAQESETAIVRGDRPKTQEFHVFIARIRSELGELDESLAFLDEELDADGIIFETAATLLIEQGKLQEAITHLEKAALLSETPELINEQLYELYTEVGDKQSATSVLVNLLLSTHEILYWNILIQELGEDSAELGQIRDDLAKDHPGLHVEIMMHERDARGVARAARGKNFTADELWSIGHYLKDMRPAAASKLFLRALALEGASAHSRIECASLGEHVELVLPFFRERDSVDRLKKEFKQALSRHKNNIPLQREFDRLFA